MNILFEQKKPGRTRPAIEPTALHIEGYPQTTGELIEATVRCMVQMFNDRAFRAIEDTEADMHTGTLPSASVKSLAEIGRIAFGIVYNGKQANAETAVKEALQGYEDGLFKLFLNGRLLGATDESVDLHEDDTVTVVRLTFLAGRMW